MKKRELSFEDLRFRDLMIKNGGNIALVAIELAVERDSIYKKLRSRRHRVWWGIWKLKFSAKRNAARQQRWYKKSRQRMAALTIELQSGSDLL